MPRQENPYSLLAILRRKPKIVSQFLSVIKLITNQIVVAYLLWLCSGFYSWFTFIRQSKQSKQNREMQWVIWDILPEAKNKANRYAS